MTATLTNQAAETSSAITMTAVTFILAIMAAGALVGTTIFIAERYLLCQSQRHSITKQERAFTP
jgi:hypothetical protein